MKGRDLVALAAGLLFGLGLGLSGMTNPAKVLGFLDLAGRWDPSLMFVMMGAIAVHLPLARWMRRAPAPRFDRRFHVPPLSQIDRPLLVGAALFGVGWGLVGYCPGPAVVGVASLGTITLVFFAAMVAGMLSFWFYARAR